MIKNGITMKIIYDDPKRIVQWVAEKNGQETYHLATGMGLEENGELVFGVVFAIQSKTNVFLHMASDGTSRINPAFIAFVFDYAFNQLGCNRVTGIIDANNDDAIRFVKHLGFVEEGRLREANPDGTDQIVFGMLFQECRYLEGKYHEALNRYFGLSRPADNGVQDVEFTEATSADA